MHEMWREKWRVRQRRQSSQGLCCSQSPQNGEVTTFPWSWKNENDTCCLNPCQAETTGLACAPTWPKSQLNKLQVESTTVSDETFLALIPFIISGTISSEVCAKRLTLHPMMCTEEGNPKSLFATFLVSSEIRVPCPPAAKMAFVQCPSHPVCPDPWSQSVSHASCMLGLFILKMWSSFCRRPCIVPPLVLGALFHVEQQSEICCTLPKSVSSCLMQCLSCGSLARGCGGSSSPV